MANAVVINLEIVVAESVMRIFRYAWRLWVGCCHQDIIDGHLLLARRRDASVEGVSDER